MEHRELRSEGERMCERRNRAPSGLQGRRSGIRLIARALPFISLLALASGESLGFVGTARLPLSSRGSLGGLSLAPQRPDLLRPLVAGGLKRRQVGHQSALDTNARLILGAAGATTMLRLGRLALAAPLGCLQVYQYFLGRYSFEVDTLTGMALYLLGKLTSDKITGHKTTQHDMRKWAAAGLMDGSFTHWWYKTVNDMTLGITDEVARTTLMVSTTSFLYSPVYSMLFIAIMAAVDGHKLKGIVGKVKSDFKTMATATTGTWLLPNVLLFTCVMPQYRLLVSMVMNYVYLIGLAMWESGHLTVLMKAIKDKLPFQKKTSDAPAVPAGVPSLVPAMAVLPTMAPTFGFTDKTVERDIMSENLVKEMADIPLPEELPLRTPEEISVPPNASPLFNDLGVAHMEEVSSGLNGEGEEEANPEWDPSAPLVGFENSEPLVETQFAFDNTGILGLNLEDLDAQSLNLEAQPFDSAFDNAGFATAQDSSSTVMQQEDDIAM